MLFGGLSDQGTIADQRKRLIEDRMARRQMAHEEAQIEKAILAKDGKVAREGTTWEDAVDYVASVRYRYEPAVLMEMLIEIYKGLDCVFSQGELKGKDPSTAKLKEAMYRAGHFQMLAGICTQQRAAVEARERELEEIESREESILKVYLNLES